MPMESAERPAETRQRGGVLFRTSGARTLFIPIDVALEVAALSAVTEIAGMCAPAIGIALAEGRVVTVLAVGDAGERGAAPAERYRSGQDWPVPGSDRAVLCDLGGEVVALTGGEVLATGFFDAEEAGDGVVWRGEHVPRLDVRALYARAEAAIWAARAARHREEIMP